MSDKHDNCGTGMIGDAELLALADGQLDRDPNYKAWLEETIERDPALKRRANIFRAQTAALRAAYEPRLSEPIPPRLLAALEMDTPHGTRQRTWAIAASIAIAIAAGGFGWTTARWQSAQNDPANHWDTIAMYKSHLAERRWVTSGRNDESLTGNRQEGATLVGDNRGRLPEWLTQEISLRIRLPDLSAFGYRLVSRGNLEINGTQVLRLDYRDDKGRPFNLFLRPRWSGEKTDIHVTQKDGIAFASWMDGPLSSAIATQLPKPEAMTLATMIRRALQESTQGNADTGETPLQSGGPRPSRPGDGTPRSVPFGTAPIVPGPETDQRTSVPLAPGRTIPAKMGTDPGAPSVDP